MYEYPHLPLCELVGISAHLVAARTEGVTWSKAGGPGPLSSALHGGDVP